MNPVSWSNFPLPLVQVNPPSLEQSSLIVETAYKNGIFSNSAALQMRASKTLAEHVGSKFCGYIASNNTMALTACLISIGVRGKHVVISNFTFPATLDAVILAGGIPVVCDVNPETLVLDTEKVMSIIKKTDFDIAVVLPTRVFGFVTDMSELISKCAASDIPVVVDAAASFPHQKNSWNFQHSALYEVFSLHATKVFGIGEGGLVIGDPQSIEKVRQTSNFGFRPDGSLKFTDGLNAKADEFTSSRALARYLEYSADVEMRRNFVQIYKEVFSKQSNVRILRDSASTIYSYFPVIFSSEENLLKFQKVISPYLMSRRYYFPTMQSGYIGDATVVFDHDLEISEQIARTILCLPVYVSCDEEVKIEIRRLIHSASEVVI